MTIQEAARIANISRQTLYRWIEKGLLSREKDKNLSFVSLAEVQALCNQSDKPNDTDNVTSNNQDTQQDVNRVTVDRAHYDGLLVRLGQYEAERRYLIEYKADVEAKDKELAQIRADAERKQAALEQREAELDRLKEENERLKLLKWWERLFRRG